jgi:hypothetical protein
VRPIFFHPRSSNSRKNVAAAAPRCLQNVIASEAGRESLAGDSLDSDRIRVMEALARGHFPYFFSQAIPSVPSTLVKRLQCCSRVTSQPEETLLFS